MIVLQIAATSSDIMRYLNKNAQRFRTMPLQEKVAKLNTHSEERFDAKPKETGRSPENLLEERSLHSQARWHDI